MTVSRHVDDLKVFHIDVAKVTHFRDWLSKKYSTAIVGHHRKIHDYLGMILNFSHDGKVIINKTEYIKAIIVDFPEETSEYWATLAANQLFDVRDPITAKLLPEEQARAFYHSLGYP
jgi:hypothetical protein